MLASAVQAARGTVVDQEDRPSQEEAHHDHPAHRSQPPAPAAPPATGASAPPPPSPAVAALIATGYVASATSGPDTTAPTPTTGTDVSPSAQTQRVLNRSIAGQYGSRSAAAAVVNPSAQTMRELNRSIAGQYGPAR